VVDSWLSFHLTPFLVDISGDVSVSIGPAPVPASLSTAIGTLSVNLGTPVQLNPQRKEIQKRRPNKRRVASLWFILGRAAIGKHHHSA
jgi:hypothetical protein